MSPAATESYVLLMFERKPVAIIYEDRRASRIPLKMPLINGDGDVVAAEAPLRSEVRERISRFFKDHGVKNKDLVEESHFFELCAVADRLDPESWKLLYDYDGAFKELLVTRLREILSTMDVPSGRVNDLPWLARNLQVRNSDHPDFAEAREIIVELYKHAKGQSDS